MSLTEADYRACARRGMTKEQAATSLGVSAPALVRAQRRYGIVFADRLSRSDDEQALQMLRLRGEGQSSRLVAAALGVSAERVRVATQRVKDADLLESGEPADELMPHYRWARGAQ